MLLVNGIGYDVRIPERDARALVEGDEVTLLTRLVVREDSLTLFGFPQPEERRLFDVLTGVSGVGPRLALAILGALSPVDIAHAVAGEDAAPFRTVSGIGPKLAKLIVVSLAGRVDAPVDPAAPVATGRASRPHVLAALQGLGWSESDSAAALDAAPRDIVEPGALLKWSLQWLDGAHRA